MSDTVVAIVSAFFVIGITVGIIVVIALSVFRPRRPRRPGPPGGPGAPGRRPPRYRSPGLPPDLGWDDNHHPRWPGDADNDFSGG
jgi:hypothetical protein